MISKINTHKALYFHEKGITLVWTIVCFTILSALAAGVVSTTNTNRTNELNFNYNNQARYFAESGLNYALGYATDITSGAKPDAVLTDLNNTSITNLDSGERISILVSNISGTYDYAVTSTGTVNLSSSLETNYKITNIINCPPPAISGTYIVESRTSTIIDNPTTKKITVNSSSLNDFSGGVSFNPILTGSPGVSSKFSGPVGQFGTGVRIYFTFKFSSTSTGDGFVFALVNADVNTYQDNGGPRTGSHGSFLGYAGPGLANWGNGMGLRPPKIGLEFDIWNNGSHDTTCSDGRNDPNDAHIAYVYWGNNGNIDSANYLDSFCPTEDDNAHNIGGANTTNDPDPLNPSSNNSNGFYSFSTKVGNDNTNTLVGGFHSVRMEITRSTSAISSNSNGRKGMYAYRIKTWYNCTNSSCNNMQQDYTSGSSPDLDHTIYLTKTQHDKFDTFLYGYHMATGAATAQIELSYPLIGLK